MTEAQLGLLVTAPIIIIFSIGLYRARALSLAGTIATVTVSVAIASVLFLTQ